MAATAAAIGHSLAPSAYNSRASSDSGERVSSQVQSLTSKRNLFLGGGHSFQHRTVCRLPKKRTASCPQRLRVTNKTEAQEYADEIREFRDLEKRWQAQVSEGKVKSLSPREAGYALKLAGHVLLDVRPASERKRTWVKGSVHIPAFDAPKNTDITSVFSKASNFILGGWWSGSGLTKPNERFMPDVAAAIPKSTNVVVACQKGLRSLAVCEQMYKAGYRNLFWVNGGFDSAEEDDFEREGPQPLKFGGIGGVSEIIGWTDQQRAQAQKEGIGYRLGFFARAIGFVLTIDLVFLGGQQLVMVLHDLLEQAK